MKLFFVTLCFSKRLEMCLNINFLVTGNINKKPKKSDANPGVIKSIAANAIAAPEINSYVGTSFFII